MKIREFQTEFPEDVPEWYWKRGLYDALITGVETFEFPFDYDHYTKDKTNYKKCALVIKLDSKGAEYDNDICEIHFYNYRIVTDTIDLSQRKRLFWFDDQLSQETNGRYMLNIVFEQVERGRIEQFTYTITFDSAETVRNN